MEYNGWTPKTDREKEIAPRVYEMIDFGTRTMANRSNWNGATQQLSGFLFNDNIERKKRLFHTAHGFISEWRNGGKDKIFDLPTEMEFWDAYMKLLCDRNKYCAAYKLIPQCEIQHTLANNAPYRADFLNKPTKIIFEINGSVHDNPPNKEYDRKRTCDLSALGYTVITFTDKEIKEDADEYARQALGLIEGRWMGMPVADFRNCVMKGY